MSAYVLGVDTTVLVRFFTRDDERQAQQALQIITAGKNQPIYVGLIVLVELAWVLTRVKHWPQAGVFDLYRKLLQSSDFVVEQGTTVERCLKEAEDAGCDLADAIIAAMNERAGCRTTITFDHDAQALSGMSAAETFA